jgi:hypothetical protein
MRVSKVALRVLTPVVALVLAVAAATPIAPALARSGAIAAPAAVVAADPPETAAVPQSSPAQRECSTWRDVGSLRAAMCITPHPDHRYQVTAWVRNRTATQHTVAVWLYFRVGLNWASGRNFYRGGCGLSVNPPETVQCDTRLVTINRPEWRWKWGIARVHDVQDDRALNLWNLHPLS